MIKNIICFICFFLLSSISSCRYDKPGELPSLADSYRKNDKKPFGSYVAFESIKKKYANTQLITSYNSFSKMPDAKIEGSGAEMKLLYFLITKNLILTDNEVADILKYVNQGNDLFISADYIDRKLLETFFITMNRQEETETEVSGKMRDTHLAIKNKSASTSGKSQYGYFYYPFLNFLTNFDDYDAKALGWNEKNKVDFVKITLGGGNIFIHTAPRAFSNYFLLTNNNEDYLTSLLLLLNQDPSVVYWDEHYKNLTPAQNKNKLSKGAKSNNDNFSSFNEIKKHPSLLWAFWISLIAILIFIIFSTKRKQRIISEIPPKSNATVAFTETIGMLYFQHKNNKRIAEKMITYFYESVRNKFFMKAALTDSEYISLLSGKSGVPGNEVQKLIETIRNTQSSEIVTDEELLALNAQIESFNKKKK